MLVIVQCVARITPLTSSSLFFLGAVWFGDDRLRMIVSEARPWDPGGNADVTRPWKYHDPFARLCSWLTFFLSDSRRLR